MTPANDNSDEVPAKPRHGRKGVLIALAAAGIGVGAVTASAIAASATTTTSGSAATSAYTATTTASTPTAGRAPTGKMGGAAPVRSDEKAVSAAIAAKLKAAALKAVPGGTVYRVETDAGDGVYEAHMTKADGTQVTVKFDKNLAVIKVESGMGAGDPAPAGGKAPAGGTAPNGG